MTTSEVLSIPATRSIQGSLDTPTQDTETATCVIACPPHPNYGGNRHDSRLQAVSNTLTASGISCLRFDYGPWDHGRGELTDVTDVYTWAAEEYETVAIFGYSFGGCLALCAADIVAPKAVSALAPVATLDDEISAINVLESLSCPVQIIYGERDTTAPGDPFLEYAEVDNLQIKALPGDHFFVGKTQAIGSKVGSFLSNILL